MEPQYLDDLAALNKYGNDYIRLLRVLTPSSRPREATLCELRVFSLKHAPRYSALSYCRQPGDGNVSIDVRGSVEGSFLISHDLRNATRAAHHHRRSDWLWIDAICINQSSNAEKNDQVRRMRAIYEMAYAGFIWLGTTVARRQGGFQSCKLDRDSSRIETEQGTIVEVPDDNVYQWLDEFAALEVNMAWMEEKDKAWEKVDTVWLEEGDMVPLEIVDPKIGSRESRHADLGLTHGKVMQLAQLADTRRAWWCRTWIIQEMVLPSRLYVCVGSQIMRWDQLVSAKSHWEDYSYKQWHELGAHVRKLEQLNRLRKNWHNVKYSFDTMELLQLARDSYATDARDNIYGILGLMDPQDKEHIEVNYGRAVDELYAEVTTMLIVKYQSMHFIVNSFWYTTDTSQHWLPSWVIDYGAGSYAQPRASRVAHVGPRISISLFGCNAGRRTSPCIGNSEDGMKLDFEAVVLDKVAETLESDEGLAVKWRPTRESEGRTSNDETILVPQWFRIWLLSATTLVRSYSEREGLPTNPRRTLKRVNDVAQFLKRAGPEISSDSDDMKGSRARNNDMLDDIILNIENLNDKIVRERLSSRHDGYDNFMFNVKRHLSYYALFATESGFVGRAHYDPRQSSPDLGPFCGQSVLKDDIIVVPRGASMPWALRETAVEGEYKLITDCFVHGIMRGELMSLVESGQLQTQRFTLV